MHRENSQVLSSDQTTVLSAFSRALGREMHVLQHYPNLLWQQMYNRLKCKSKEALLIYPGYQKTSKKGWSTWKL